MPSSASVSTNELCAVRKWCSANWRAPTPKIGLWWNMSSPVRPRLVAHLRRDIGVLAAAPAEQQHRQRDRAAPGSATRRPYRRTSVDAGHEHRRDEPAARLRHDRRSTSTSADADAVRGTRPSGSRLRSAKPISSDSAAGADRRARPRSDRGARRGSARDPRRCTCRTARRARSDTRARARRRGPRHSSLVSHSRPSGVAVDRRRRSPRRRCTAAATGPGGSRSA